MKRRLDLASALVHQPEVLFLDEPTTGLDPASRITIWDEMRRINEQGTTIFLTTQYLEEADQLCDRLAIIDGGKIVREGTPRASRTSSRNAASSTTDPTLDDVFLDVTGRTREQRRRRGPGGQVMSATVVLGQARRCARRGARPRRCCPTLFIPLFFLVVNAGQAGEDLPVRLDRRSSTARTTARSSCRARCCSPRRSAPPRCTSSRTSRAATSTSCARPRSRAPSLVFGPAVGRGGQERRSSPSVIVLLALPVRRADRERSARLPACSCCSPRGWAVVYTGFMQLIALKTRSAAATNSGGLSSSRCCSSRRTSCRATASPGRWRSPRRSTPSPT